MRARVRSVKRGGGLFDRWSPQRDIELDLPSLILSQNRHRTGFVDDDEVVGVFVLAMLVALLGVLFL